MRYLSEHRRARLIAWALAMLAWVALTLFGDRAPTHRHMRQRQRHASLHALTRLVRNLTVIRAAEIANLRRRPRLIRDGAGRGFRRRTQPLALMRAAVGSGLRKAFKRGDRFARLQFLVAALSNIDAFARRYLVPRAVRGLTRLCPVLAVCPPAAGVAPGVFGAPTLAVRPDTS